MRRVHGEAVEQVIPGEQWKGPTHIHNIAEFPRERLFSYCHWNKERKTLSSTVQGPKTCPLERQKRNCPFPCPCGMIWEETLSSSSLSPSLASVERVIYKIINPQINIIEKDFDMQTPYLQDRSNAFLITDSPHREIFDLEKPLIWTFDFMVECSWCEWEVSSLLPLIVFSVYKDFLEVYDVTFNPSYKYTTLRS